MLLFKDEYEGDLVNCLILQLGLVSRLNDFFSLINANNLKRVIHVGNWNLLDLKHIIRVKDSFEIFCRQELRLELIQAIVVWVHFIELPLVDGLEHFQNGCLGIGRFLVQDVSHQFLCAQKKT